MLVSNKAQGHAAEKRPRNAPGPAAGTARGTWRRRLATEVGAVLALLGGLLLAPQLASTAQAAEPGCLATGISSHAGTASFSYACPDGVTYHYSYFSVASYPRAICYTFAVSADEGQLGWATFCRATSG